MLEPKNRTDRNVTTVEIDKDVRELINKLSAIEAARLGLDRLSQRQYVNIVFRELARVNKIKA